MQVKPGSSWLDRLWSLKGLPAADTTLNIDHYLHNPQPPDRTTHTPTQQPQNQEPEPDIRSTLQNTLCELFSMKSEPSNSNALSKKKKVPRKQVHPKCVRNSRAGMGPGSESESEEEGYSRSEVTVIDTSFEVWKSDKWVFRKNDVWKVKDKRGGKSGSLVAKKKKKRKKRNGEDGVENKGKISRVEVRELLKDSNLNHQDGKRQEVPEDDRDYLSQVPRKRIRFSRSPKKYTRVSVPIVAMEGLPPIGKSEGNLSKIPAEDTQRSPKYTRVNVPIVAMKGLPPMGKSEGKLSNLPGEDTQRSPKKFNRVNIPIVAMKGLPPIGNSAGKPSNIPAEDTQRQHQD